MKFADMHIHVLCGTDDGPETPEQMYAVLDASYADGVRLLCVTPHYHPGYFGNNGAAANAAYEQLAAYAAARYPDLKLYRGNELRYGRDCVSWLDDGLCRTLGSTRCVLVDFAEHEKEKVILSAADRLLNAGYVPVLAHGERYRNLPLEQIEKLHRRGVRIQIDVQALLGGFGFRQLRRSRKILKRSLADFVASDAHDTHRRPPELSQAYHYVRRKYGMEYAGNLFWLNAIALLNGDEAKEER